MIYIQRPTLRNVSTMKAAPTFLFLMLTAFQKFLKKIICIEYLKKPEDGNIPFLLGGNVVPDDAKAVGLLRHPQFAGVDLNEQFEVSVGVKDVERLQKFIASVKQ